MHSVYGVHVKCCSSIYRPYFWVLSYSSPIRHWFLFTLFSASGVFLSGYSLVKIYVVLWFGITISSYGLVLVCLVVVLSIIYPMVWVLLCYGLLRSGGVSLLYRSLMGGYGLLLGSFWVFICFFLSFFTLIIVASLFFLGMVMEYGIFMNAWLFGVVCVMCYEV